MSFGFIMIEVCDANPAACNQLFNLEAEFPGVSVLETSCMSECELCAQKPYVFVDGERMDAPTVDELLAKVKDKVKQSMESE